MRLYFFEDLLKGHMSFPLITVFIPTYRRPQLLKRAIESVLSQTCKELCVLICDNASQDETAEIVARFAKEDPRIQYFCHAENIGMLGNYEFGFSQIGTEYFSVLSDDDMLLPHFCETALKSFQEYPESAFFAGSSLMITAQGQVFRAPLESWSREGLFASKEALLEMIGNYPVPTTVMYRTECVSRVKIDFANQVAWDCDFLIQLAGQYPIVISKKPCGYFVFHSDSFSGSLTFSASMESTLRLIHRVEEFSWLDPSLKSALKRLLRKDYYRIVHTCLSNFIPSGHLREAVTIWFKAFRNGFLSRKMCGYFLFAGVCFIFPFMRGPLISLMRRAKQLFLKEKILPDGTSEKFKQYNLPQLLEPKS